MKPEHLGLSALTTIKTFVDEIYEGSTINTELASSIWREFVFWQKNNSVTPPISAPALWDGLKNLRYNMVNTDRGKEVCGLQKKIKTTKHPESTDLAGLLKEAVIELRRIADALERKEEPELMELKFIRKNKGESYERKRTDKM